MTTTRLLYDLQEMDQEKENHWSRLFAIEEGLGNREALNRLQVHIEQRRERLRELRLEQRHLELAAQSIRQKTQEVEGKLYGGSVRNPRELESLDQELRSLRRELKAQDDQLLELMMTVEEIREELEGLEEALKRDEEKWKQDQEELIQEKNHLEADLERLESQRKQVASHLDAPELKLYERLMAAKGGLAVARVERGLCRACSMTLPTHQLQRARMGREPVLCSSCGRILYVS